MPRSKPSRAISVAGNKRRAKQRHISISGATHAALKAAVGAAPKGRISRTVDKLVNDYIDSQEKN